MLVGARSGWANGTRTTVALDLTRLADRDYSNLDGLGLEKRLVLRLVQEGFAVVGLKTEPQVVVTVSVEGRLVVLHADSTKLHEQREVDWEQRARLELLHLELVQKTVDLVRAVEPAAAETAGSGAKGLDAHESPPSANEPVPNAGLPIEPSRMPTSGMGEPSAPPSANDVRLAEPSSAVRLGAAGGALLRSIAVDPILRAMGTFRAANSLWLGAELGFVPASNTSIQVLELLPTASAGTGMDLGAYWRLGATLRTGALIHRYALQDTETVPRTGWRGSGYVGVALRADLRVLRRLDVELSLGSGFLTSSRKHELSGTTLWERGQFPSEVTLGIVFCP